MLDKKQVLDAVTQLSQQNNVTLSELTQAFELGSGVKVSEVRQSTAEIPSRTNARNLTDTFYIIGALIICIAIGILISQSWEAMSSAMRLLSTLGLGSAAFIAGWWREKKNSTLNQDVLSSSLFLIAGAGIMTGAVVLLNILGLDIDDPMTGGIGMALAAVFFGVVYAYNLRNVIVLAMGITAGASSYSFFANSIGEGYSYDLFDHFYAYSTALLGIGLVALGRLFYKRVYAHLLTSTLYSLGSVICFASLAVILLFGNFFIGRTETYEIVDEFLYAIAVGGGILASIVLNSRHLLVTSALFLTFFILYIGSKYFSSSLGWPFTLLLAGGFIMAIAYLTRQLGQRYIR